MTKTKEDFYHPKGYSPKIGDMVVCEDIEWAGRYSDIGLVTTINVKGAGGYDDYFKAHWFQGRKDNDSKYLINFSGVFFVKK